ncbi:MAG: hypothetical protein QOI21_1540 [Actinomycetota bacterium]|nr:hypothetical protein [Actinomycetota bacterium]
MLTTSGSVFLAVVSRRSGVWGKLDLDRKGQDMADRTEKLFRVAITLKGVDGGLQVIGALILALVPSSAITGLAHAVITRDLLGDPSGVLAQHLQTAAEHFVDGSTKTFAVVYLLAHGLIKLGLVLALARKIVRAYPVAAVVLGAFVVYEVIRAVYTHSIALPFFAALDLVIIFLVLREYRELRAQRRTAPPS